ncbi:MAG: DUF1819 family protein [Spirochaetes bacterium]|nr:DUF1819 family protein [Spirochaetota bacterium]
MNEPYRLSFTFGGLLFPESVIIAQRYQALPDWDALKAEAKHGELLRKTRSSSRYRYFREIRDRFSQAWPFELELIAAEGNGARHAAFAICCRYYLLLGDFVHEVVRDKLAMREDHLGLSDYYHFLEEKAPFHPELSTLSEITLTKLRQVTFRMLTEGMLLENGREHRIKNPSVPESLVRKYREQGDTMALEHLLYRQLG